MIKYIGKTVGSINDRFSEHIRKSKTINTPLYYAMRKYGVDNFYCELIESNINDNLLSEREKYWIKYYNSYIGWHDAKGYNATIGGEGQTKYSDDEILTLWNNNFNCSEIGNILNTNITTISRRLKQLGVSSQDIQNRVSLKNRQYERDPVLQYDKKGNFIKEWDTAAQIERELKYLRSNIKACCNGKIKSAYGYIWKRKNEIGPQRKAGG